MKINDLSPNPKNPRTITEAKLKQLKNSLEEFGDLGGFVFNRETKQLVGGHQRAKLFGKDSQVVIEKKYSKPTRTGTVAEGFVELKGEKFRYREVNWDEIKEKAANIAANKGAGEWDFSQLGDWMKDLNEFGFDLDLTMFDEDERKKLFESQVKANEKDDEVPATPKVAKTKLGDIYQLGEHKLICGDSTNQNTFVKLLGEERTDMCFTSPPYNLGENMKLRGKNATGKDSAYNEKSDHKDEEGYLEFLTAFTNNCLNVSDTVFVNIQLLAGNKFVVPRYWMKFHKNLIDLMIWDKEHGAPAMAPKVLNSVFEMIFILSDEEMPTRSMRHGQNFRGTMENIFRLNPMREGKDELAKDHGAVFPVAFAEHFLLNFSDKKVLDPFGGSGTTMIACEKLKRKCFMIELDPIYCDVIVARWEKYTNKKAELLETYKIEGYDIYRGPKLIADKDNQWIPKAKNKSADKKSKSVIRKK